VPSGNARLRRRLRAAAPLLVLIGLCLLIGAANPYFFHAANLVRIANSSAIPAVLMCGETFVILLGSIDLSIEGVVAVGATVVSLLVRNDVTGLDFGLWALLLAVLVGLGIGALSGVLHVGLRIPSFMVTLGVWFAAGGLANFVLGGGTVRILDPNVRLLALGRFAGLPLMVWVALAVAALAWVIQRYTRYGRYVYAIGGGEDVAALSGIPIRRVKIVIFALGGAFYALGGALAASQLGQGNAVMGVGRLFPTITAVVVGGTSLVGGEGGVAQSLIGVLIVAVLGNGMVLLGFSPYVQQAVQGLLIIAAVAISVDRARMIVK
jgi:ribose transport system permease protein